jgi:hypothetical protein
MAIQFQGFAGRGQPHIFAIYRKNISVNSGGFAASGFETGFFA